jgi:hypothetical protein
MELSFDPVDQALDALACHIDPEANSDAIQNEDAPVGEHDDCVLHIFVCEHLIYLVFQKALAAGALPPAWVYKLLGLGQEIVILIVACEIRLSACLASKGLTIPDLL